MKCHDWRRVTHERQKREIVKCTIRELHGALCLLVSVAIDDPVCITALVRKTMHSFVRLNVAVVV